MSAYEILVSINKKETVPTLIKALADNDRSVVHYAILALGVFGSSAKEATPKLLELGQNPEYQSSVANTIWKIDPKYTMQAIVWFLNAKGNVGNRRLEDDCERDLVDLGEDPLEWDKLANRSLLLHIESGLADIIDHSIPLLMEEAINKDPNTRQCIAEIIRYSRSPDKPLIEILEWLKTDVDADVRREADTSFTKLKNKRINSKRI